MYCRCCVCVLRVACGRSITSPISTTKLWRWWEEGQEHQQGEGPRSECAKASSSQHRSAADAGRDRSLLSSSSSSPSSAAFVCACVFVCVIRSKAGARGPPVTAAGETAASAVPASLGAAVERRQRAAASPLDGRTGRNVPTHLHQTRDRRGTAEDRRVSGRADERTFIYLICLLLVITSSLIFTPVFFFSFFISTSSLKLVCPYFTPPSLRLRHFSPTPSHLLLFFFLFLPSLIFPLIFSFQFFFYLPVLNHFTAVICSLPRCFLCFPLSSPFYLSTLALFIFFFSISSPPFPPSPIFTAHLSWSYRVSVLTSLSLSLSHLSVVQSSELMILWSSSHHRSLRPSFYECGSFKKKKKKRRN